MEIEHTQRKNLAISQREKGPAEAPRLLKHFLAFKTNGGYTGHHETMSPDNGDAPFLGTGPRVGGAFFEKRRQPRISRRISRWAKRMGPALFSGIEIGQLELAVMGESGFRQEAYVPGELNNARKTRVPRGKI